LGVTLFGWAAPLRKRLLFAGLVCVGPTLWYLPFTGAEVLSWSLAVLAVIALDARRYGLAAAAAGLKAIQNPPQVVRCGAVVVRGGGRVRERAGVPPGGVLLHPLRHPEPHRPGRHQPPRHLPRPDLGAGDRPEPGPPPVRPGVAGGRGRWGRGPAVPAERR